MIRVLARVVGVVVVVVAVVVVAAAAAIALGFPRARATRADLRVEQTPDRVERGRYLSQNVADCFSCHSPRDFSKYSAPPRADAFAAGNAFPRSLGFPGDVVAPNLTPAGPLAQYTDDQLLRALREGVAADGRALFGFMPYASYRVLSDDDARSIVAYLRTLPPVASAPSASSSSKIDFPVSVFVRMAPVPLEAPVHAPDRTDRVAWGGYLATIAGCKECHSPHDDTGAVVEARAFGGGFAMKGPWGVRMSANLSPSRESFVGNATREQFVSRFAAFRGPAADVAPTSNTPMPWVQLAGMTDDDLGAIYDYLRAQRPIDGAPPITAP